MRSGALRTQGQLGALVDEANRSVDVFAPIEGDVDLTRFEKNPAILWANDDTALPIGLATSITKKDGGIAMTIKFASAGANPIAELVYQCVREGAVRGVDIAVDPESRELLSASFVNVPIQEDSGTAAIAEGVRTDSDERGDYLLARHCVRIPVHHRPVVSSYMRRRVAQLEGKSEHYLKARLDAIDDLARTDATPVIAMDGPCVCTVPTTRRGSVKASADNAAGQPGCECRRMIGLRDEESGPKAVFENCSPTSETRHDMHTDTRDESQLWDLLYGHVGGAQLKLDRAERDSSASEEELTSLRAEVAELRKLLSAKVRERTTRTTRTHKDFVRDPKSDEDDDSEEQSPALKDALAKPGQMAAQKAAQKGMKKACEKMDADHFDAAESDQIAAMIEDARAIANQQNKHWGAEEAGMARGRAQALVAAARFDAADTVEAAAARNRADRHTAHMSSNRAEAMSSVQDTPVVTIDGEDDAVEQAHARMIEYNRNAWRVGR